MATRKRKKSARRKTSKKAPESATQSARAPAAPAEPRTTRPTTVRGLRPRPSSLSETFESLAGILVPYARMFESEMHPRMGYCLKAKYGERPIRELYFGGVRLHQDHASFHLFLLYSYPDLEDGLSPELRRCLEGKTCFRIELGDGALIEELKALTRTCYERFRTEGLHGKAA